MRNQTVLLAILDGQADSDGEIIDPATCIVADNYVPVTANFDPGKLLGRAKLRREGIRVYADLEINDVSYNPMHTPSLGGYVPHLLDGTSFPILLKDVEIREVGMTEGPNSDARIKSLGEQLRELSRPMPRMRF